MWTGLDWTWICKEVVECGLDWTGHGYVKRCPYNHGYIKDTALILINMINMISN